MARKKMDQGPNQEHDPLRSPADQAKQMSVALGLEIPHPLGASMPEDAPTRHIGVLTLLYVVVLLLLIWCTSWFLQTKLLFAERMTEITTAQMTVETSYPIYVFPEKEFEIQVAINDKADCGANVTVRLEGMAGYIGSGDKKGEWEKVIRVPKDGRNDWCKMLKSRRSGLGLAREAKDACPTLTLLDEKRTRLFSTKLDFRPVGRLAWVINAGVWCPSALVAIGAVLWNILVKRYFV